MEEDVNVVDMYLETLTKIRNLYSVKQELERHMNEILDDSGGRILESTDGRRVERYADSKYEQERYKPLLEYLNSEEIERAYTPAYTKQETVTVPEHWDTVKLLKIGRDHGGKIQEIIDGARVDGRLKFKEQK